MDTNTQYCVPSCSYALRTFPCTIIHASSLLLCRATSSAVYCFLILTIVGALAFGPVCNFKHFWRRTVGGFETLAKAFLAALKARVG